MTHESPHHLSNLTTARLICADSLTWLQTQSKDRIGADFGGESSDRGFDLVYIDPPFNTGRRQIGPRGGYEDSWPTSEAYIEWLQQVCQRIRYLLSQRGSLFVHVDPRESHYVKVMLDKLFGRASFQNEIVWAYDYGGRTHKRWPAKHDIIFWYSLDPDAYTFNRLDEVKIPYIARKKPGSYQDVVGKFPTDVWWNSICQPNGPERTGYPTQKPVAILDRIVKVHSNPGDRVLDCFAGSGTTGEAALVNDRHVTLVDRNPEAIVHCRDRLISRAGVVWDEPLLTAPAEWLGTDMRGIRPARVSLVAPAGKPAELVTG